MRVSRSSGSIARVTISSRSPATTTDRSWADALVSLVKEGRASAVEVRKVDGESVNVAPVDRAAGSAMPDVLDALRAVGFVDGYRGLTHRG